MSDLIEDMIYKRMKQEEKLDKIYEELAKESYERKINFLKAYKHYLLNSDSSREFVKEMIRGCEASHIGYVKVQKVETTPYHEYPSNEYFKIIPQEGFDERIFKFSFVKFGEGNDHWLVWQTCGYSGDDYSGFMMFPMRDGIYWLVDYSC